MVKTECRLARAIDVGAACVVSDDTRVVCPCMLSPGSESRGINTPSQTTENFGVIVDVFGVSDMEIFRPHQSVMRR